MIAALFEISFEWVCPFLRWHVTLFWRVCLQSIFSFFEGFDPCGFACLSSHAFVHWLNDRMIVCFLFCTWFVYAPVMLRICTFSCCIRTTFALIVFQINDSHLSAYQQWIENTRLRWDLRCEDVWMNEWIKDRMTIRTYVWTHPNAYLKHVKQPNLVNAMHNEW